MKKLVVIATAAALAAGISFASAQSSTGMSKEQSQAADKMQKSDGTKDVNKNGQTTGAGGMAQEKSNPGSTKPATSTENKGAAGKGN